jgi:ubiquinone/menaquinone biosynthesis C-methylase UbiE/uncharacterized protein YbaR (Trm112 family)
VKKKVIDLLTCPNTHTGSFTAYAKDVLREGKRLRDLNHGELRDDDNIETGVLIDEAGCSAYPIIDSVAVLLSDDDADPLFLDRNLRPLLNDYPAEFQEVIKKYLERIEEKNKSAEGAWNLEEMRYYDKGVDSEEQREKMLTDIETRPIWRLFIPRKKQMTRFLQPHCPGDCLLEIGCGNARTMSWILPPAQFNYHYIGIDISYKRLLVASRNIPEGDFIQASAFNLPFKNQSFQSIVSFGMLHHLPNSLECLRDLDAKIKDNGFLAFHEPILKPKLAAGLIPKLRSEKSILKKILTPYEHSEHDHEIDSQGFLAQLQRSGYKIINLKYYNSVFKTFIEILLRFFPAGISGAKLMAGMIAAIDVACLKTICKLSRRLGPHAIIGVFKKEKR